MRKRKIKREIDPVVLAALGRIYPRLLVACRERAGRGYGCYTAEDLAGETLLLVAQDNRAKRLDDDRLAAFFLYRFDMVRFQTKMDYQQLKEVSYADYLQARETEKE